MMARLTVPIIPAESLVAQGPLVDIVVSFDHEYEAGLRDEPAKKVTGKALIDTGATASSLDAGIIASLALPLAGTEDVGGITGVTQRPKHAAFLRIPALEITIRGTFVAGDFAHAPYIALLGRTFLRHFRLTYDGRNGVVELENGKPDPTD